MEKLFEIFDKHIGETAKEVLYWKVRNAARVVIFDKNKIATLNIKKYKFHNIIGGGIDEGESAITAAMREAEEEAGVKIKILEKIGTTLEHKTHLDGKQRSTFFTAEVIGSAEIKLTEEEKETQSEVEWMTLEDAIKIMKKELKETKEYQDKFSLTRNITILEYVKKNIQKA